MAKYKALSQEFAADMKAAVSTGPRKTATLLLYTIALVFVVAVVWASRATVDEVTISMGTVIPTQQVQVVQNLEGGILAEILVAEGDLVEAGQRYQLCLDLRRKPSPVLGPVGGPSAPASRGQRHRDGGAARIGARGG